MDGSMLAFGGFRRGGSSIGFMILQHLLLESGLSCKDEVQELWDRGVTLLNARHALPALRQHHMVGCFRSAPRMSTKSLAQARLYLLVRDPRDCQLSWYHARHLHQPEGAESVIVDQALIHEDLTLEESFDTDVASLLDWCELSGGRIFRYEDMVMNPLEFIMDFAEFSGLPLKRSAIDLALLEATFFQPALDPTSHNRSGIPFEALRTLPPQQLKHLNERFEPLLARLGYPLDPISLPALDLAAVVQRDAKKRYICGLAEQNALRMAEIAQLEQTIASLQAEVDERTHGLAEQNAMRIDEAVQLKRTITDSRSELERRICELPEQNGLRIIEIAGLRQAMVGIRSEIELQNCDLAEEVTVRTAGVAALTESVANCRSEIEQLARELPEQNGLRIVEVAELRQAWAAVREEIEELKRLQLAARPVWRKLLDRIFPAGSGLPPR